VLDFYERIVGFVKGRIAECSGIEEINAALHDALTGAWLTYDGKTLTAEVRLRSTGDEDLDEVVQEMFGTLESDPEMIEFERCRLRETPPKRFFADVAADSGKWSGVFAVLRQYYDRTGFADQRQAFNPGRQVLVDRQPYPARDAANCPDVSGFYPTCLTRSQIESELQRLITADGLPTAGRASSPEMRAKAPIYFVFLPADVSQCLPSFPAVECGDKVGGACGYHQNFTDAGSTVLYASIMTECRVVVGGVGWPKNDQADGLPVLQEPNGNIADVVLTIVSHELSEAVTDPVVSTGWFGRTPSAEIGDECFREGSFRPSSDSSPNAFTPTLGGSASAGTLFDQLINGHPYYTQSEWSDGAGNCEMRPSAGRIVSRFATPRGPQTTNAALSFNPTGSTSTNAISSATWDFGDGSKPAFSPGRSALTRVKHDYRRAGRYTITLTLVDNRGNLQTTTRGLTVHAR
jgi:hypothetical protein